MTDIPDSLLEVLKAMPEFKTCAWYDEGMNQVVFIAEDVPLVSDNDPDNLIQLLRAGDDRRIIGFKIENPKVWMKHCKG